MLQIKRLLWHANPEHKSCNGKHKQRFAGLANKLRFVGSHIPLAVCLLFHPAPVRFQTGIAWFPGNNLEKYRSSCKDTDKLKGWGWQRHNGRSYGHQVFEDPVAGLVRTCSLVSGILLVSICSKLLFCTQNIETDFAWHGWSDVTGSNMSAPVSTRFRADAIPSARPGAPKNISVLLFFATAEGSMDVLLSGDNNPKKRTGALKRSLLKQVCFVQPCP